MTKKEVMAYLRISHQTLYKLMKTHTIAYYKLERRVLFSKDDIDAFLKSRLIK